MADPKILPPCDGVLPCLVCQKPVEKGDWFLIVSQAIETVSTGTPYQAVPGETRFVPQRPVHLSCLSSPKPPEEEEEEENEGENPFVPCEVPEDILALIRWRDGHALDWWGEELVFHNLYILERMERHELPEELRATHDSLMGKDENERYNLMKSALMLIGSY